MSTKKSIPERIAEHNIKSESAEVQYIDIQETISSELRKIMQLRQYISAFELRLLDQVDKFQKEIKKLTEE